MKRTTADEVRETLDPRTWAMYQARHEELSDDGSLLTYWFEDGSALTFKVTYELLEKGQTS